MVKFNEFEFDSDKLINEFGIFIMRIIDAQDLYYEEQVKFFDDGMETEESITFFTKLFKKLEENIENNNIKKKNYEKIMKNFEKNLRKDNPNCMNDAINNIFKPMENNIQEAFSESYHRYLDDPYEYEEDDRYMN